MCIRTNNEGTTLIELIISMAITAIVLSMIVMLINVTSHSFRRTNEKVNLQQESQIAINQISTLAMEASEITESASVIAPDVKYLLKGSLNCYAIVFIESDSKLFLVQGNSVGAVDIIDPTLSAHEYLLAEYVDSIEIDYLDGKTAKIIITFALGEEEYTTSKKVKLRNVKSTD